MLLLTDRPVEGRELQTIFGQIQPCDMVTLDDATEAAATHAVIVCHADLASLASRQLLDAALTHHRATLSNPVVFMVAEGESESRQEAIALGATELLPADASREHLLFTMRRVVNSHRQSEREEEPTRDKTQRSVEEVGGALLHLLNAAGRREPVSIPVLERGADALVTSIKTDSIKSWLSVVRRYDNTTYQHCLLVAALVANFCARLGLAPANQRLLAQAALIHDIGKARIPHAILNKAGPLSPAEMQVMRTHAAIGHGMLSGQRGLNPTILDVVRHHHEYLDGTGYPDGLKGSKLSDFVRIVTICDVYGAMIERRPYKAPMAPLEGRAVLHGMGIKLDASLLEAFDAVIKET